MVLALTFSETHVVLGYFQPYDPRSQLLVWAIVVAKPSGLCETVSMSEKRTKADKAERQADRLEEKTARRPPQLSNRRQPGSDLGQEAARTVKKKATEDK